MAIVENAGEDLITDDDLQGTPQEILGKLAQKVSFNFWDIVSVHVPKSKKSKTFSIFGYSRTLL